MAKYTKQQAVSIIVNCAKKYKECLEGYQLLFLLKDKHKNISSLEVEFNSYNFLHLTGIKLNTEIHRCKSLLHIDEKNQQILIRN